MKKFEFSLNHMLDYKDRILDEEKRKLQRLKNERDELERRIHMLEQEFRSISREKRRAEEEGTTALEVRGYGMQLTNIRRQLEPLRAAWKEAGRRVERQTLAVIEADREVSKLDKLQDKQYEVYVKTANKAEEKRIEELISLKVIPTEAG